MRRYFIFTAIFIALGVMPLCAATRDARVVRTSGTTARTAVSAPRTTRPATTNTARSARAATSVSRATTTARGATISRAATDSAAQTRTGAAYETCKASYFACMDQFCAVKNANYKRCSCSDKIFDITQTQSIIQDAGTELTEFTENLGNVGLTASQATVMKQATEGEKALTDDGSASAAILQAIMNSIKGENANVGGIYEGMNSINIQLDDSAGLGGGESANTIANYNGKNIYTAVYGTCRDVVRADCTDASLQRAITAYLMAIEQDCNSVQTQLEATKKKMVSGVREADAMLKLARVENRKTENSLDITACLDDVERAVLSEEVCGANYHKCLDNGKYIDVATGKPLTGVVEFYKLQELLNFATDKSIDDQRLAKNPKNRAFVNAFEGKVRSFAQPVLDKCREIADDVWADYLDKAMLEIYYAQRGKVDEIKTGCMDFVSACYTNGERSITAAMSGIINGATGLAPDTINLLDDTCKNYVAACDKMFDGNIIAQYIDTRKETDLTDSCRAIVQQCFDNFGGVAYNNFYNPVNGLFSTGRALDWFSYEQFCVQGDPNCTIGIKSPCAQKLSEVAACNPSNDPEFAKNIFGGFDTDGTNYGLVENGVLDTMKMRANGVATEVYNQIVKNLTSDCANYGAEFVQYRYVMYQNASYYYQYADTAGNGLCTATFSSGNNIRADYLIGGGSWVENMCPQNYWNRVDTTSWGVCSCWENGGRRSDGGISLKCIPGTYNNSGNVRGIFTGINAAYPKNTGKICPKTYNAQTNQCFNGGNVPYDQDNLNLIPDAM
ncbi:MAG: hypothetical protein LBL75_03710 [Rickettsiales bacterium]|nr:hypothetical protein [Rickettsiales bacterium]